MTDPSVVTVAISSIPVDLKEKLEKLAEADKRKLSAYIRIVLEKHVQAIEAFKLDEVVPA